MSGNRIHRPEVGQMLFAGGCYRFDAPDFVVACLLHLGRVIERVEWNRRQEVFEAPLGWGPAEYRTDVFVLRGFCYPGDDTVGDEPPPNFESGEFKLCWYKRLGRGTSMNMEIDANAFAVIFDKCLESVRVLDPPLW